MHAASFCRRPSQSYIQFDKARSTAARDDSILNKSRNPVANLFNGHNGYVTKVFTFSQYL